MLIYYILMLVSSTRPRSEIFGSAAHAICTNINQLKEFSLEELSTICNVSYSTISRLSHLLDYRNFNTMTGYMSSMREEYLDHGQIINHPFKSDEDVLQLSNQQLINISENISKTITNKDMEPLKESIKKAKKVSIFGSPIPQAAYSLQMELGILGIESNCYLSPKEQYIEIQAMNEGDVALIYDCSAAESIFASLMEVYNGKFKVLVISSSVAKQRIYKPDQCIYFKDINFAMNLHSASIITYNLIALLQTN